MPSCISVAIAFVDTKKCPKSSTFDSDRKRPGEMRQRQNSLMSRVLGWQVGMVDDKVFIDNQCKGKLLSCET